MNQLTYTMAITRQQELLKQAARHRLARQTSRATKGKSRDAAGHSRRGLQITTTREFAS